MNLSTAAPLVNFAQLQQYVGRRVRLIGEVQRLEGNVLSVKAADGGMAKINLRAPSGSFDDKYVLIEGTVGPPDTVTEESRTNFGNSFDLQKLDELCKLASTEFAPLFI